MIGQQVASLGAGLGARTDADANSESVSGGADRAVTDKESTTQFDREMEAIKGEERSPAEAADPEPDSMPEADPAPESGAVQDAPFIGR